MRAPGNSSTVGVVLLLCLMIPAIIQACSLVPDAELPQPHTMEETLYAANIVLYARASTIETNAMNPEDLTVLCVFKDTNNELPGGGNNGTTPGTKIIIDYQQQTSCNAPWPAPGLSYILALRSVPDGMYVPAEPDLMERAIFEDTAENFQRLLKVCGLQNPTGSQCPDPEPEEPADTDDMGVKDDEATDEAEAEGGEEEQCIEAEYIAGARNLYMPMLVVFVVSFVPFLL